LKEVTPATRPNVTPPTVIPEASIVVRLDAVNAVSLSKTTEVAAPLMFSVFAAKVTPPVPVLRLESATMFSVEVAVPPMFKEATVLVPVRPVLVKGAPVEVTVTVVAPLAVNATAPPFVPPDRLTVAAVTVEP